MAEEGVLIQFSTRTADSSGYVQVTPKKHSNVFLINMATTVSIIWRNLTNLMEPFGFHPQYFT